MLGADYFDSQILQKLWYLNKKKKRTNWHLPGNYSSKSFERSFIVSPGTYKFAYWFSKNWTYVA